MRVPRLSVLPVGSTINASTFVRTRIGRTAVVVIAGAATSAGIFGTVVDVRVTVVNSTGAVLAGHGYWIVTE